MKNEPSQLEISLQAAAKALRLLHLAMLELQCELIELERRDGGLVAQGAQAVTGDLLTLLHRPMTSISVRERN